MIYRAICTTCGHAGMPAQQRPGSGAIELVLWIFFLIPGLIYSLWRSSAVREICPSCGRDTMLSRQSPVGIELMAKRGGWTDVDEKRFRNAAAEASRGGGAYAVLFGVAAALLLLGGAVGGGVVASGITAICTVRWILRLRTAQAYLEGAK